VQALDGLSFDVVVQSVAFQPAQVERDLRLFAGRCGQYVFVSSASAYAKPLPHHVVTEATPLGNPVWEYSRAPQAGEERLRDASASGVPVTIVRPSHTYSERSIPVNMHGGRGSWVVLRRLLEGRPVVVHGDGESLWTFTWADDLAVGFVGLFGHPDALGRAVHITSDESLTWNRAFATIADVLGVTAELVHVSSDMLVALRPDLEGPLLGDKAASIVFDNTLVKTLVPGFACPTTWAEGVARGWAYLQDHPEARVDDPEFDAFCDRVVAHAGAWAD